jgi:penicillin-binding protein 1C
MGMSEPNDTRPVRPVSYVGPAGPPPAAAPQKGSGCGGCLGRAFLLGLLLLAILVFGGAVAAGTYVYATFSAEIDEGIATLEQARDRETFETTRILDRNGELLWEIFGEGKRTAVPLERIPPHLIQATVAVEDGTFYENIGLDAPSLVAALIANLRNPDQRPMGGSTITQQLVRHIVFDYEERTAISYERKTKEIVLAWMMNREYSKDEIMALYLNEIYYGNLAYGIEAAAETYFDKSAADLTLAEASFLAALPQSPVDLDPYRNFEGAKSRQWLVLNLMANKGYATRDQIMEVFQEPLELVPQEVSLDAPHFAVYARQQLEEQFGADMVANGGLRVTTTLDLRYQRLAEQLARQHIDAIGPEHNMTNAALVALQPRTGEILAMLGSVDYQDETIDGHVNVTLRQRQPGSAIKPLTYAAALSPRPEAEPAWTAADILWDVEVEYPQFDGNTYAPRNYDRRFRGPVRLRGALANSYNVPAVLVLQDIGVDRLIEISRQMGIQSFQDAARYGLSLTLGGGELTPLELTAAYAILAHEGQRVPPVSILRVARANGEIIYEHQPETPIQVLDPRVAFLISDILDDDNARIPAMGRDNPLALPFAAAVKTGTTDDFRDNWTVGYTPSLAVGVWTGNNDNSEMIDISGLQGAAPLWSDYMIAVYNNPSLLETLGLASGQPAETFEPPPGLERRPICNLASVTIGATECAPGGQEWFLETDDSVTPTPTVAPDTIAWEQLDPAVWRIPAVPLAPAEPELIEALARDDDAPPPQLFCHFVRGTAVELLPPETEPQLFLTPPRNPQSLKAAHEFAQANDLAILPTESCTEEILAAAGELTEIAVYRITSPKHGDVVDGIIPIEGTANFNPAEVEFYKIELGIPQEGSNEIQWVTLGDTHNTPVVNGTLEMFHAAGLPPGDYFIRLIVVKDSNYVGEPYTIQVTRE